MKKEEFIASLKYELKSISPVEREEIVRDQEEYIRDAIAAGRNEEEVVDSLGSPKAFAAGITIESKFQKMENTESLKGQVSGTFGAVFAILALAPLNLIFVMGPFLAICGITMGGWAVSGAVFASSLAMFAVWMVKLIFVPVGLMTHLSAFFFALGMVGLGLLCFYVMAKLTRLFIKGTVAYLRFNLRLIQGKV